LGDAALLRRVVDNLLTNAIKFSPRNTMVEVHVGVDGSDVTLDVVDEGLGVPEEMRGRIFEKYEIVKVRAAGGPQTGLGLPFCRTVVEAHGGYISCLPREGRGSRFHVKFPAAKATPDV
jgi:signal transduction histidine kinase